jgi:hypothetical protein
VKSLRLDAVAEAAIGVGGIDHDRSFLFVHESGRVATQRTDGGLARLSSSYDAATGELELRLPDGTALRAVPVQIGEASVDLWGRHIAAAVVDGPFAAAVSDVLGRAVRLLRVPEGIRGLDSHAVSVLSQASVDEVARRGGRSQLDPRRFRPTLLVDGCGAHVEDAWVGGRVRAGEAVLRVVRPDPRCSLTTLDPDTGERDADTLRWLASYRRADDGEVYCGIYADVEAPGRVRVGDPVEPLEDA